MGVRENEPQVVEILRSLPGAGRIAAATLLAEASRTLLDGDYQAIRTLAGIAPVTRGDTAGRGTHAPRRATLTLGSPESNFPNGGESPTPAPVKEGAYQDTQPLTIRWHRRPQ